MASFFEKKKDFFTHFTSAVGSLSKLRIFVSRICATLKRWVLGVEAISVEFVNNLSINVSLGRGMPRLR